MVKTKTWYKSRTVWGLGLAVVIGFAQANGFASEGAVVELAQLVAILLGIVGVRGALK